jgi:hypothetical protein
MIQQFTELQIWKEPKVWSNFPPKQEYFLQNSCSEASRNVLGRTPVLGKSLLFQAACFIYG